MKQSTFFSCREQAGGGVVGGLRRQTVEIGNFVSFCFLPLLSKLFWNPHRRVGFIDPWLLSPAQPKRFCSSEVWVSHIHYDTRNLSSRCPSPCPLIPSADEAETCLTIRIMFTGRWIGKKMERVRLTWLCVLLMFSICTRVVVVPCVDAFCSFYASLESTPPFITPSIRQLTSLQF